MDTRRLFDELSSAARKLGIEVRIEPFQSRRAGAGGVCRLRGRTVILIDEFATQVDQAGALAEALAQQSLENVYLAPEARMLVETARKRLAWRETPSAPDAAPKNVEPLPRAKPGVRSTRRRDGSEPR